MSLNEPFGPQYAGDDDFKARARLHQSRFRVEELGLAEYNEYGNRLAPSDAATGKNFYPSAAVLEAVRRRYGLRDSALCRDMLRSEHIPFNFFVPLRDCAWTPALIRGWCGQDVQAITKIDIEWAPKPASDYLDDNTSFDAYVEYTSTSGALGALGIEVKYTEREYGWGDTERARMFDETSAYLRVHRASELYSDEVLDTLRTPRFKQLWRNQLLGEAMLQKPALRLEHFTSVLLFPGGNTHFVEATREYADLLAPERKHAFAAVTFETFIEQCRALAQGPTGHRDWLGYLERRYIISASPK